MASSPWPGIRPGSSRVEVYNEGLLVFLLDESHLRVIEESEADLESGYAETDAEIDKPLKKLAKEGVLQAYELVQDDAVVAEVIVGPRPTRKELSVGRWHKPQTGFLRLPSGVLRIDTGSTLPLVEDDPEEEPGRVIVPSGDYVLTLYRLDWDKLVADGLLKEGDEWAGPQELLVLTPKLADAPMKGVKPLLRLPPVSSAAQWLRKYTIEDGVFQGKAFAFVEFESCSVNIDLPAAEALGITAGSALRIEVEGLVLDAVYIEQDGSTLPLRKWVKTAANGRRELGLASRPLLDDLTSQSLYVERIVGSARFPILKTWIPARVSVLEERFDLPVAAPPVVVSAEEVNPDELAEIEEMFEE